MSRPVMFRSWAVWGCRMWRTSCEEQEMVLNVKQRERRGGFAIVTLTVIDGSRGKIFGSSAILISGNSFSSTANGTSLMGDAVSLSKSNNKLCKGRRSGPSGLNDVLTHPTRLPPNFHNNIRHIRQTQFIAIGNIHH